ncbi:hypothetical protein GGI35DRAFT_132787 [Trichoderma velutinum]
MQSTSLTFTIAFVGRLAFRVGVSSGLSGLIKRQKGKTRSFDIVHNAQYWLGCLPYRSRTCILYYWEPMFTFTLDKICKMHEAIRLCKRYEAILEEELID